MRWLLPFVLLLAGLGAGIGAGLALHRPLPAEGAAEPPGETRVHAAPEIDRDYVKLNNQFIVPVIAEGRIRALVVISLNLELARGGTDLAYAREPKLRDAFLRVMFDHANSGGFTGEFTANGNLAPLRAALTEAGRQVLGASLHDVLITDIARQDK